MSPTTAQTLATENNRISLQSDIHLQGTGKRREFTARLVRAGRIRRADNEPGPFVVTADAIQSAVNSGQFEGLAVFADHPGWFDNPSIKALIGVTKDSHYNQETQSADATIRFYSNVASDRSSRLADSIVDMLHMMLADNEEGIQGPDIGMSIVFWPIWQPGDDSPRILQSFKKIDSADVVFGPAADGRILEALSAYTTGHPPKEVTMTELRTESTAVEDQSPSPERNDPPAGPATPPAAAVENLTAWRDAAGQEAALSILAHAQLPDVSKERLAQQVWSSPEQLYAAIESEREYLATLTQQNVVQLYGGPPRNPSNVQVVNGLDQMQNAVDWMFGVPDAKIPEPQLRRMDMVYSMLTGDYEFHGVFNPDRVFLASATTGTLANMAANAMNKVIIAQLALLTHYRWYEMIALPTPNDGTLHDMQWTSFGGIGTLPIVTEGGAYDELDVDDVKEADTFYKYGGYVGITREMIKNSDIQRIQAVPRALASASVKTRSSKIAAIFTTASGVGPTLDQDSVVLFHADHGNLATTAIGTDLTAWRAAATECFKHTEVNSSDRISLFPKYCLVPPDLYHQALSNFGYGDGLPTTYTPEAQDRGIGDPRPVPLAVPHFTDVNDWAYVADPRVWPVVHMSFSADPSGRTFPGPELWAATSETGGLLFTADVLPIKVRDEFAYGVNGFRGIGKRNVA